jgi:hypothetical protein
MPIVGIGLRLCARRTSRQQWQNGSWNLPGIAPKPAIQNHPEGSIPSRSGLSTFLGEHYATLSN